MLWSCRTALLTPLQSTFDSVSQWKKELETNHKGPLPPILFILGLKSDINRAVSDNDMKQLADTLECEYGICSSKTDSGVTEVFTKFGASVKHKRDKDENGDPL